MKEVAILPEQAPVMPLPGAILFPHALLPLYIFEPRYRQMLVHALAHERLFCVALLRPERAEWKDEEDFFDVATIGLIRACVGRGDGTSNLILQGLQRVRYLHFPQLHPFPIAETQPFQPAASRHRRGGSDPAGNFRRLFATFRTPVGSPPPPVDDSRRFDTRISAAHDWRLPVHHYIESAQTASPHRLVIESRPSRFFRRSSRLHPAPADRSRRG